jgi:hypothetical protein
LTALLMRENIATSDSSAPRGTFAAAADFCPPPADLSRQKTFEKDKVTYRQRRARRQSRSRLPSPVI